MVNVPFFFVLRKVFDKKERKTKNMFGLILGIYIAVKIIELYIEIDALDEKIFEKLSKF